MVHWGNGRVQSEVVTSLTITLSACTQPYLPMWNDCFQRVTLVSKWRNLSSAGTPALLMYSANIFTDWLSLLVWPMEVWCSTPSIHSHWYEKRGSLLFKRSFYYIVCSIIPWPYGLASFISYYSWLSLILYCIWDFSLVLCWKLFPSTQTRN